MQVTFFPRMTEHPEPCDIRWLTPIWYATNHAEKIPPKEDGTEFGSSGIAD
jgi:hypothetical protein